MEEDKEIASGAHDLTGKKRKALVSDLQPPSSERGKPSIAELTRPDQKANTLLRARTRKP